MHFADATELNSFSKGGIYPVSSFSKGGIYPVSSFSKGGIYPVSSFLPLITTSHIYPLPSYPVSYNFQNLHSPTKHFHHHNHHIYIRCSFLQESNAPLYSSAVILNILIRQSKQKHMPMFYV